MTDGDERVTGHNDNRRAKMVVIGFVFIALMVCAIAELIIEGIEDLEIEEA